MLAYRFISFRKSVKAATHGSDFMLELNMFCRIDLEEFSLCCSSFSKMVSSVGRVCSHGDLDLADFRPSAMWSFCLNLLHKSPDQTQG